MCVPVPLLITTCHNQKVTTVLMAFNGLASTTLPAYGVLSALIYILLHHGVSSVVLTP